MYNKENFYSDVCTFNRLAGKDHAFTKEDLLNQIRLIQEELDETRAAIEQNNTVEILDGAVDVTVTVFGLLQQLENKGYDVDNASNVTAKNNLSKFVFDKEIADKTLDHLRDTEKHSEFHTEEHKEGSVSVYVIKDQFNKVRKPLGYIKNNLSAFVPNNC